MAQQKWNIDTIHSTVGFTIRHLMVSKVHGLFTKWQGSLEWDDQNPAGASAQATIDVSSIDTREPGRDTHLRSPDFFDAEKFPQITFKSTKVEPAGAGEFKVTGDLTMHGVTKPIVLDVEYAGSANHPQMGQRIGFSAKTSINRKDFGVIFNMVLDSGGLALSEKVEINIDVQAGKAT
jgi:polyisoprenoid-binding protein YceI